MLGQQEEVTSDVELFNEAFEAASEFPTTAHPGAWYVEGQLIYGIVHHSARHIPFPKNQRVRWIDHRGHKAIAIRRPSGITVLVLEKDTVCLYMSGHAASECFSAIPHGQDDISPVEFFLKH